MELHPDSDLLQVISKVSWPRKGFYVLSMSETVLSSYSAAMHSFWCRTLFSVLYLMESFVSALGFFFFFFLPL